MASVSHDDVEPVTDHVHDNSWSANLEKPQHEDRDLVLAQAVDAIEHTASGNHVNLVTHETHGHPESYLYPHLDDLDDIDEDIEYEYVDQCGCGGHVTRVHVE